MRAHIPLSIDVIVHQAQLIENVNVCPAATL